MPRLITRGRLTRDYWKGLVSAPEDRELAVRKAFEATGAKLVALYFTTGDSDFLTVTEADEPDSIIAALMSVAAAGTISDVTTCRAWTGAEFKAIAEKAKKAGSAYRAPG